ncbi:MAG: biotin transporter BioY [Lachnospiraceae bacterium]|nr:biotin transporter BioY [Lachnospiraceae bacterium]
MNRNLKLSTHHMALIGVMTALICVLSPLSITLPISPVPFSFGTLALYLSTYLLGRWKGLLTFLLYLLLGFVGLPVFAGFTSGPGKLIGPTGGYLIGEVFLVLLLGFLLEIFQYKQTMFLTGMILGTLVCYFFGSLWLAYLNHISLLSAISIGALPYLPFDAVKVLLAFFLAPKIRGRLLLAKLI